MQPQHGPITDWVGQDFSITGAASVITLPAAPGKSGQVVAFRVRAPGNNTDIVYVRSLGTATAADLPINIGDDIEIPHRLPTLSVLAATGTQHLIVTVFYR